MRFSCDRTHGASPQLDQVSHVLTAITVPAQHSSPPAVQLITLYPPGESGLQRRASHASAVSTVNETSIRYLEWGGGAARLT